MENTNINKKTNHRKVIIIVILVIVLAMGLLYFVGKYFSKRIQQPVDNNTQSNSTAEIIQDLKETSEPVTSTPEEQAKSFKALEKVSKPVKTSTSEQLDILQKLSQ